MAKAGLLISASPLHLSRLQFFDAILPRPSMNEKIALRYPIAILHLYLCRPSRT